MRTVEFTIAARFHGRLEWALAKAAYAMPGFESYFLPNVHSVAKVSKKVKEHYADSTGRPSSSFLRGIPASSKRCRASELKVGSKLGKRALRLSDFEEVCVRVKGAVLIPDALMGRSFYNLDMPYSCSFTKPHCLEAICH